VAAHATYHLHEAQLRAFLRSPDGDIAKALLRMGLKVESQAKKNLERTPRRVDTGRLRASIRTVLTTRRGTLVVRIGTDVPYARPVHFGTGLYGPMHRPIVPVRAKALRFKPKGGTKFIFRRSVKGMKPNAFLVDALQVLRKH